MPAPSELVAGLRVGTSAEMADAVTRSRLADGRTLGWYGDPSVVIDGEIADQQVPPQLAVAYPRPDRLTFWRDWTAAEAAAKASDVPIVIWLRTHGLGPGPVPVCTIELDDLVVSAARIGGSTDG